MNIERKVAVITGASQGIGAALVESYRARFYLAVPGDIADRKTAERVISEGWLDSGVSTRSSTTPASSSPSLSPSIR